MEEEIGTPIPSFSCKADTNKPQPELSPAESGLPLQSPVGKSAEIQQPSPEHHRASISFQQTGGSYPNSPRHSESMAA